ncbi:MAG: mannose-1-phosphate guanylyltransferase/mannose-6-phosphate isomerase [Rhodobacteraceae bacterium]|nr:mannose-1-phosphate guanylyltransferase/mannose-6-phosphate isomerase [Paracoccaceae bacterium]
MLTPVILCGGSGTRLWPLSRKGYPKQFVPLTGQESLFQATARRLSGPPFRPPLVVTAADFRFIAAGQLAEAGVTPGAILIEPEPRNTGPAVLAAALHALSGDPDALLLVAPSDHVIGRPAAFRAAVEAGIAAARAGRIVTFGAVPDRAETGYGWLEPAEAAGDAGHPAAVPLRRFVEKPRAALAAELLAGGRHLWNMGIFLARADALVAAFDSLAPDLGPPLRASLAGATRDLDFLRLASAPWGQVRAVSFDYAVMEQAADVAVVRCDAGWSDLGDWEAVAREVAAPRAGVTAIDCDEATLLRADGPGLHVVGLGLRGIVAVAMPDAVLVADRARAQDVRLAVERLRERGVAQADALPRVHRPWGWYETLVAGERFQVKRILVAPGGILSLQSHVHRAEHWVVVTGTVRVTIGDRTDLLTENQSAYIPLGTVHRLENPGRVPAVLIEVQTGAYLAEDDIRRFEDAYARGSGE